MSSIIAYNRNGETLSRHGQKIVIRTRRDGSKFLFQESPNRKYLSGLLPRPDRGENIYQVDLKAPDGTREYFLLELGEDRATLRSAKYNNGTYSQILTQSVGESRTRANEIL